MKKTSRIEYDNLALEHESARRIHALERHRDRLIESIGRLKESESRYHQILNLLPEIIFEVDKSHNVTFLNNNAFKVSGYTSNDVDSGLSVFKLFTPAEHKRIEGHLKLLFTNKQPSDNIYNAITKQGKIMRALVYSSPILREGKVIGIRGVAVDISEEQQIQEQFDREHDLLETILQTANVMIVCLDSRARILVFNDECERITGYRKREVIGKSWPEIFVPADLHWPSQYTFADWVRMNPRDRYEKPIIIKNGERRNILWSNSVIIRENNNDLMAIAIGIDITDHKQAEIALSESEEKYQKLLEDSNDAIYRIVDNQFEFVNDRFVDLLGWSREEILSPDFDLLTLVSAKSKKLICDRIRSINRGETVPNQYEYTAITKDGRELELSVTISQVSFRGKNMTQGIYRDITAHKKYVEALAASEERYRAVWQNSPVGICLTDKTGIYRYVNPAYCNLYGYDEDELIGKTFMDLIAPPEFQPKSPEDFVKSFESGISAPLGETQFIRKDGRRIWVQYTSDFVRLDGAPIFKVSMNIDITAKKEAENELRNSELRFKAQFKSSPLPIYSFQHQNGQIVLIDFNDAAIDITYGRIVDLKGQSIELIHGDHPEIIESIYRCYRQKENIKQEVRYKYHSTGEVRYFVANYIFAPPDLVLVHTEDITGQRANKLKDAARLNLLSSLRGAITIDNALSLACRALAEAELFRRSALTLHNKNKEILNIGYYGLPDDVVQQARNAPAPDMKTAKGIIQEQYRISNSYFIPSESGLDLYKQGRYIDQPDCAQGYDNCWRENDDLFTPIIDDNGAIVGWLSVDTPFDGSRPSLETVKFLEEVVDIVIKKTVSLQQLEEINRDRESLAKKNIALSELLALFEKEKQGNKARISETVNQILLPSLFKSVNHDGTINQTYFDSLLNSLQDLARTMGKEIPIYSRLSGREVEICHLIKQGLTSKNIANVLHVTEGTVQKHREKIRRKLGIAKKDVNLATYLKNL